MVADSRLATAPGDTAAQLPVDRSYAALVGRLASAQKSSVGAPGYSRWVNRRIGRYLAAWSFRRGLLPNQVTFISAVLTFASIAALAVLRPSWWLAVAVTVGLLAGYAFDSADGQLARLRGGGTPSGEWLDHVVDCAKCSAIHLAVLISWSRFFGFSSQGWLLVPIAYTLVSAVWFFAVVLSEQLRRSKPPAAPAGAPAPVLRSVLVLPADYGLLALIFITYGLRSVFVGAYLVLLVLNAAFLLLKLRGWYAELSRPAGTAAPGPS